MKTLNCYMATLAAVLILGIPVLSSGSATSREPQGRDTGSPEIVIHSDLLEVDDAGKTVLFKGNVDARKDDFVITCREMRVFYLGSGPVKGQQQGQVKINKIVATGEVKIVRTDGSTATAEKAVYYQDEEKVELTGEPVIRQGDDLVQGAKIILFLKDKRSIVEGSKDSKVKAVLSPRDEKR